MSSFYAAIGMAMLLAAIVWYVSPRSRRKIRRLALWAVIIAVALAVIYEYSHKDTAAEPVDPPGSQRLV